MGFLDKITGKKPKKLAPPPPPMPPPKPQQAPMPQPEAKPPMPEPDPVVHSDKLPEMPPLDIPPPMPESKPAPPPQTPPPKMMHPSELPPMPSPPSTKPMPEKKMDPPKPSPSREDVRKAFADIPPITVDKHADDKSDGPTNDRVASLDVDKLVLPDPSMAPKPEPLPEKPKKPKEKPKPAIPKPVTPEPVENPFSNSPPPKNALVEEIPVQTTRPSVQDGNSSLYVSLHKFEHIKSSIMDLQKVVAKVSSDVKSIQGLKEKEDKGFSNVVGKLQHLQDELLRIDADLFEK